MKAARSSQDKVIAGVCGGLADHLGWPAFRMRVVWLLATLFTAFAGVIVYLVLWYLMPKAPPGFEPAVMQPWKKSA